MVGLFGEWRLWKRAGIFFSAAKLAPAKLVAQWHVRKISSFLLADIQTCHFDMTENLNEWEKKI